MINQWGTPEEELIREASVCPQLSPDLRDRVLGAALHSRRRHILRRAARWAACLLLSVTGVASLHYGVQEFGRGDAVPSTPSEESVWPAGRGRELRMDVHGFPIVHPTVPWLEPDSKRSEESGDSPRGSVARPARSDGRGRF